MDDSDRIYDTMARLQAAAREYANLSKTRRRETDNVPVLEPAPWLTEHMENEGLVEDRRFQSAFEPFRDRQDDTAVEEARKRSEDLPDFSWAGDK